MPYLPASARFEDLDEAIDIVIEKLDGRTNAVFNYTLSRIAGARVMQRGIHNAETAQYVESRDSIDTPEDMDAIRALAEQHPDTGYETRAEVYGSIMAFVGEFKRRVLDDYETTKVHAFHPRGAAQGANPDLPEYDALTDK